MLAASCGPGTSGLEVRRQRDRSPDLIAFPLKTDRPGPPRSVVNHTTANSIKPRKSKHGGVDIAQPEPSPGFGQSGANHDLVGQMYSRVTEGPLRPMSRRPVAARSAAIARQGHAACRTRRNLSSRGRQRSEPRGLADRLSGSAPDARPGSRRSRAASCGRANPPRRTSRARDRAGIWNRRAPRRAPA